MKFGTRVKLSYLIAGTLPVIALGIVAWVVAQKSMSKLHKEGATSLKHAASEQLVSIRDTKKAQVEQYFVDQEDNMETLTETVNTLRSE
ncbi:MAG: hypothetical protein GY799_07510, partial [Desulfobulbaceae bacterium]|nr:hypothetical protein [Desulfobulbaceae bacterium]